MNAGGLVGVALVVQDCSTRLYTTLGLPNSLVKVNWPGLMLYPNMCSFSTSSRSEASIWLNFRCDPWTVSRRCRLKLWDEYSKLYPLENARRMYMYLSMGMGRTYRVGVLESNMAEAVSVHLLWSASNSSTWPDLKTAMEKMFPCFTQKLPSNALQGKHVLPKIFFFQWFVFHQLETDTSVATTGEVQAMEFPLFRYFCLEKWTIVKSFFANFVTFGTKWTTLASLTAIKTKSCKSAWKVKEIIMTSRLTCRWRRRRSRDWRVCTCPSRDLAPAASPRILCAALNARSASFPVYCACTCPRKTNIYSGVPLNSNMLDPNSRCIRIKFRLLTQTCPPFWPPGSRERHCGKPWTPGRRAHAWPEVSVCSSGPGGCGSTGHRPVGRKGVREFWHFSQNEGWLCASAL